MDKIPKFRRKPKPPVLETAIDRNGSVASDSMSPSGDSVMGQPQRAHHKMAPFRSLRLRGPSKRARDSPPADLTPTTPSAVVVAQDGIQSPPRPARPASQPVQHKSPPVQDRRRSVNQPPPVLPAFLTLSQQGASYYLPSAATMISCCWSVYARLMHMHVISIGRYKLLSPR